MINFFLYRAAILHEHHTTIVHQQCSKGRLNGCSSFSSFWKLCFLIVNVAYSVFSHFGHAHVHSYCSHFPHCLSDKCEKGKKEALKYSMLQYIALCNELLDATRLFVHIGNTSVQPFESKTTGESGLCSAGQPSTARSVTRNSKVDDQCADQTSAIPKMMIEDTMQISI